MSLHSAFFTPCACVFAHVPVSSPHVPVSLAHEDTWIRRFTLRLCLGSSSHEATKFGL
ncbi:hypothetical protein STEG23_028456, partial [Scotinomys teguina]